MCAKIALRGSVLNRAKNDFADSINRKQVVSGIGASSRIEEKKIDSSKAYSRQGGHASDIGVRDVLRRGDAAHNRKLHPAGEQGNGCVPGKFSERPHGYMSSVQPSMIDRAMADIDIKEVPILDTCSAGKNFLMNVKWISECVLISQGKLEVIAADVYKKASTKNERVEKICQKVELGLAEITQRCKLAGSDAHELACMKDIVGCFETVSSTYKEGGGVLSAWSECVQGSKAVSVLAALIMRETFNKKEIQSKDAVLVLEKLGGHMQKYLQGVLLCLERCMDCAKHGAQYIIELITTLHSETVSVLKKLREEMSTDSRVLQKLEIGSSMRGGKLTL